MLNQIQGFGFAGADLQSRQVTQKMVEHYDDHTIRVSRFPYTDLAIILPVFNEASRIHLVDRFVGKLVKQFSNDHNGVAIYFVNDGSNDGTDILLSKMIAKYQRQQVDVPLRIINFAKNTRKSAPYIAAYHRINAKHYLFVDSDDSFLIEDVVHVINTIKEEEVDAVIGKKGLTVDDQDAKFSARIFIRTVNRLLSKPLLPEGITDSQTGLKVFSRKAVIQTFSEIRPTQGFASDLVVMHEMRKGQLSAMHTEVEVEMQDGSHVNVVKDSINHFKILMSLYAMKLRPTRKDRPFGTQRTEAQTASFGD